MKLSAQEEYGLRCLLALARAGHEAALTIPEIAELERITPANAAKLLRLLRRTGFVVATRGQQGGYALARPAAQVNVGEALSTLGGRLYDAGFCGKHAGVKVRSTPQQSCAHSTDCSVRSVWQHVQRAVDGVLGQLTLADLLIEEKDVMAASNPIASRRQLRVVEVSA